MAPEEPDYWSTGTPLCCHSWNKDHSLVAVCPTGTGQVLILRLSPPADGKSCWTRVCALDKHEGQVSAVDWGHTANRIVTGSYDGNAYVWEMKSEALWAPTLVQLRSSRAVLCAAWSPSEAKFAVGSGARTVSVCYFDHENGWWVSKVIRKKHESSVTSTAWHPNNMLLATTSTDNKCRIFSAAIKDVDPKSSPSETATGFSPSKFGEQLLELDLALGWAYGVAWSPSGTNLAFAGHDSSIHFINNVGPNLTVHSLFPQNSPLRDVCFLSENMVVAAGFDSKPLLFKADAQGLWSFVKALDSSNLQGSKKQAAERHGQPGDVGGVHSGPILSVRRGPSVAKGVFSTFSTAGLDGRLVMWDVSDLSLLGSLENLTLEHRLIG